MTTREAWGLIFQLALGMVIYTVVISSIAPTMWRTTSPFWTCADRIFYMGFGIFAAKRAVAKRLSA